MASPFRVFRKHQRTFMAVAAVLCMVIFVLGSALSPGGSGPDGRRADSAPVANWNGGSLNEGELARLTVERRQLNEFLERLYLEGVRASGSEQRPSVPSFVFDPRVRHEYVEQMVLTTEVMSDLASQVGMTVSDDVINHYLREFGLRKVADEQVMSILATVGRGDVRANEAITFSTLRKLLLEYFYMSSFADAGIVVSPQQQWEEWIKVHQRIALETAVLPVSRFVEETPDPSDAQVTQFYDEFKEREPARLADAGGRPLPIADPGFAKPRKVQLHYLAGNLNAWTEQFRDQVTEEEISDYYERNKRTEFVKLDLPPGLFDSPSEPAGTPDADQPDAEQPEAEAAPEATAPKIDDAAKSESIESDPNGADPIEDEAVGDAPDSQSDPAPSNEAPVDDGPSDDEPQEESPAEQSPADGTDADEAPDSDGINPEKSIDDSIDDSKSDADASTDDDASEVRPESPFRFVRFQNRADETDGTAEAAPNTDVQDDRPVDLETSTEPESPAREAATSDAATDDEAEVEVEVEVEIEVEERGSLDVLASGEGENADAEETSESEIEYEPLSEVREQILDNLARDKAVQAVDVRVNQVYADLKGNYDRYQGKVIDAQYSETEIPEPPAELRDLTQSAGDDLIVESTPLLAVRQLAEDTLVGASREQEGLGRFVYQAAFGDLPLYEPLLSKDLDGNWYIVTKTTDEPLVVPKLDDVRSDVIAAWKRREAAKLAEARAKELAVDVAKAAQSFSEFFADRGFETEQTEMFTWLTYGMTGPGTGRPPMLGTAPPLENVGAEFMEVAFNLEEGETASAMSFDRSQAFVIRLHDREKTLDELKKQFLEEFPYWPGQNDTKVAQNNKFRNALQKYLDERAGLEIDEEWQSRRSAREE